MRALVVVPVQPDHLDETINALRFGERTATVENHITRDSHKDLDDVVRRVRAQLAASRHTLAALAKDGQAGFMSLRYKTRVKRLEEARDAHNQAIVDGQAAGEVADKKAAVARIEDDLRRLRQVNRLGVLHYRAPSALYVATRDMGVRLATQLRQFTFS